MTEVLEQAYSSTLTETEIAQNFTAILMAGFHTMCHALCTIIWLVFTHPDTHAILVAELQGTFNAKEDITLDIVKTLPWLNAVITEALRISPPIPIGPPRVSPGAYVHGVYIPAGVGLPFFKLWTLLPEFISQPR
jgi:cytochrome P450